MQALSSPPQDSFWQQREQLRPKFESVVARMQVQQNAVALARGLFGLRASPGWNDFVKTIRDIQLHAMRQLSRSQSVEEMKVLQGQIQAYDNIVAVVDGGEVRMQALERGLADLHNEKASLEKQMEAWPK